MGQSIEPFSLLEVTGENQKTLFCGFGKANDEFRLSLYLKNCIKIPGLFFYIKKSLNENAIFIIKILTLMISISKL